MRFCSFRKDHVPVTHEVSGSSPHNTAPQSANFLWLLSDQLQQTRKTQKLSDLPLYYYDDDTDDDDDETNATFFSIC